MINEIPTFIYLFCLSFPDNQSLEYSQLQVSQTEQDAHEKEHVKILSLRRRIQEQAHEISGSWVFSIRTLKYVLREKITTMYF